MSEQHTTYPLTSTHQSMCNELWGFRKHVLLQDQELHFGYNVYKL